MIKGDEITRFHPLSFLTELTLLRCSDESNNMDTILCITNS
jgi:hypothetical protein